MTREEAIKILKSEIYVEKTLAGNPKCSSNLKRMKRSQIKAIEMAVAVLQGQI